MSLTKIYVACGGGSPGFNGIYERDDASADTSFYQTLNYAKIVSTSTDWELTHIYGNPPPILYNLSKTVNSSLPISTNSWTIINGASPAIQTYEFVTGNAQISIEITNANLDVSGTYTWSNSIVVGGGVGTVSGYYKGEGVDLIAIYWATTMWKIVNHAGIILYYGDFPSTSTTPPVSNPYGDDDVWSFTGNEGSAGNPTSVVSVTCAGGGAVTPTPTATVAITPTITPTVTPTPSSTPGGGAPGGVSIIILTGAGTAAVNGTYTFDNISEMYVHSDGIHAIAPDPDTGATWSVVDTANDNARYYSSNILFNATPTSFTTAFNDLGNGPSPTVTFGGGGGASAPVMKILMKTVQVVVIAGSSLYPQLNGIYYLVANPSDVYNSFFSKTGGDSYPRIIFNVQAWDNGEDPYFIQINSDDNIYYGVGSNPAGWPGFQDFNGATWYNNSDGNTANITTSTSTANRPHIYTNGNIRYGRT